VDLGDLAHVVVHFVGGRGEGDVSGGFFVVAQGFVVEAEVEMGVAELVAEMFAFGVGLGGGEDGFGGAGAGEEGVGFLEGDAGVADDGDELFAGFLDGAVFGADHAEEVPDGVLDVVTVDELVALELGDAFVVVAGVVVGEAALPVVRGAGGEDGEVGVVVGDGFLEFPGEKVLVAALLEGGGREGFLSERDADRSEEEEEGEEVHGGVVI